MAATTHDEIYLGDGLYATFDGWMMNIRTQRGQIEHWVALEPETFQALVKFANYINKKYDVEHFETGADL